MRIGLYGLVSAVMLASAAGPGCSSSGGTGGTGGSSSTGGSTGKGGGTNTGGAGGAAGGTGTGGSAGKGGGAGASGAGAVTTLNGSTALNALSATQATQLCNDTYAYFGTAIPQATTCKWRALTYGASSSAPDNTTLETKCTQQQTACLQGGDPWATNDGCNDVPSTCTATVAEYSACISDEVAAFIQVVDGFPMCSSLMMSNTSAIMDAEAGGTTPASCTSLANKCPDLTPVDPLSPQ